MKSSEQFFRYGLFFLSVVINAIGISAITVARIGTTPISSPNYVFSLHTPLTLGYTTMIFNALLIFLECLLIGFSELKKHKTALLMQIPVSLLFSVVIDLSMYAFDSILGSGQHSYLLSWILVISGTVMLAFGIAVEFTANVCMVPGEYFIKILHPKIHLKFSSLKIFFDVFLVFSAVVVSLLYTEFTFIEGVREGTLFAAVATGMFVRFFIPRLAFINSLLQRSGAQKPA